MKTLTKLNLLFAIPLLMVVGCHGGSEKDHDHDHDHESEHVHDAVVHLTNYNSEFELYAEAQPFVTGQESDVLLHVTRLSDFKPLEEGSAQLVLSVGGKVTKSETEKLEHAGIFHLEIKPETVGKGSLDVILTTESKSYKYPLATIEVYSDEHQAHHKAEEQEIHSPSGATFSKEMSWQTDFASEEVSMHPFGEVVKALGIIEPSQGDSREVVARSSGIVTIIGGALSEGSEVKAGRQLFRIDASQMADGGLKLRYAEAKADMELARKEYERIKALAKDGLATEDRVSQSRRDYEVAKANLDHAAGYSAGASSVAAPISGYIQRIDVANGQYVEAGQTLATISTNKYLYLKVELPATQARLLNDIAEVTMQAVGSDKAYTLTELQGKVVSLAKGVNSANGLVPLTFIFVNSPGYYSGEYLETFIRNRGGEERMTVARTGLLEESGHYFVYVQLTPEYFEKREVKIGTTDGNRTEILSGLKVGERVVSRGAIMIKLSQASGKLDAHAGHVH